MKLASLAFFGAGVIIGAIGGYFATKEAMKAKNQAEIQEMRDYYMRLYGKKTTNTIGKDQNYDKYGTKLVTVDKNGITKEDRVEVPQVDYHTVSPIVTEDREKAKFVIQRENSKPFEISEEEYGDCGYEKEEYKWYYQDKALAYFLIVDRMAEYHTVEDPYVQLGLDNLTTLEESADGYIYIRNDNLGKDYFVELASGHVPIDEVDIDLDDDDDEDI
jgi:hypothetical protein